MIMDDLSTTVAVSTPSIEETTDTYSSSYWLWYFQTNREERVHITFPSDMTAEIEQSVRLPLIRSLQRFQIGETGEGKHLRKYARNTGDKLYEEAIDLFIKEEQFHARVLAEMIQAIDGTLLSWHWTDLAFIALRRMFGLKTELFILLIAEIVGKCFYKACAEKLTSPIMCSAFSLLVLDELGHLEFHCSFLRNQMSRFPPTVRRFVHCAWCMIFFTACFVFIADHAKSLAALNVTSKDFLLDCSKTFYRASRRALLSSTGRVV